MQTLLKEYASLVDPVIEIAITPNEGIVLAYEVLLAIWRQQDLVI